MQIQEPTTIEQAVRLLLHYLGIVKITKDNVKKVYKRSKQLQVIMGGGGFWEGRMPYLKELEDHIGFVSDTPLTHSDKKWGKILIEELSNVADQWIIQEEEHLASEESEEAEEPKTINEQNEEATKELERLANSDVIQLNKNPKEADEKKVEYPY
tara:strand:- start:17 stop:481 length:465 start_codon:yes stop_codon:yes gene_type:complete